MYTVMYTVIWMELVKLFGTCLLNVQVVRIAEVLNNSTN